LKAQELRTSEPETQQPAASAATAAPFRGRQDATRPVSAECERLSVGRGRAWSGRRAGVSADARDVTPLGRKQSRRCRGGTSTTTARFRIRSTNPHDFSAKSGEPPPRTHEPEMPCLQAFPLESCHHPFCLPCRRSRVRIPSAALGKACICRSFSWRSRLVRLRRVGLTPDSPRPDRPPFQGKSAVCRPIPVRPNRSPSEGLQKVGCSACCGR
jgi:hypothetical protein